MIVGEAKAGFVAYHPSQIRPKAAPETVHCERCDAVVRTPHFCKSAERPPEEKWDETIDGTNI